MLFPTSPGVWGQLMTLRLPTLISILLYNISPNSSTYDNARYNVM